MRSYVNYVLTGPPLTGGRPSGDPEQRDRPAELGDLLVRKNILILFVVLLSACVPDPVDPTILTSTVTPTSRPGQEYQARAWVSDEEPLWDSTQTVFGKLTKGGEGVAGAQMYSIVHYRSADRRWPEEGFGTTGSDGIASVSFGIMDADTDSAVSVDVYFAYEGKTFHEVTSFTSRC